MFSPTSTITRLQKQSANALTSFTKIVSDLTSNNKEVDSEISSREEQKRVLDSQIETLNTIKTSNDKVINKIQKFLSDED